ncbi:MAG: hypothetical protein JWR27_1658 [Aeromicrobium sp.]|nr:hypothetical protein [Aeromicrobium sp.]
MDNIIATPRGFTVRDAVTFFAGPTSGAVHLK